MKNVTVGTVLLCAARLAWGQAGDVPPKFEAADIRVSVKTPNPFVRTGPVHNGRYEIKTATMVDLIRLAYGFDPDKILGGPNWLEMDRFDVVAKIPPGTTPDSQKEMLQALLQERFKLVVHKESKPLPTYALIQGKKLLIKAAEGTEDPGCKPQSSSGAPGEGTMRIAFSSAEGGAMNTLTLGPGGILQYNCRNITMAKFADGLRGMFGVGQAVGTNPVIDDTGLKGAWNFDIRWSMQMFGPMGPTQGEQISIFDAVDKQLGLKLEERQVPTPVMVVDSVLEKPLPNPPDTSDLLPVAPPPTEFDVASVKPSDPGGRGGRFQMQPGGRLTVQGMPLRMLIMRAFQPAQGDQITGVPAFADTERFDIDAKTSGAMASGPMDMDALAPLMRSLLADRFKMTYHTEKQPMTVYSLVAAKPKLKKADPASRTFCKNAQAQPGAPPGSITLTCQNTTMDQFAERLLHMTQEFQFPVDNATELEGGWDFSVTWTQNFMFAAVGGGRGGDGPAAAPSASDPSGGLSLFEAVEKQLGLKFEKQKRPETVFVIDHIEAKPTEN